MRLPAGRDKGESRMKKRLWTIALALAVVMGLLTVSALADSTQENGLTVTEGTDYTYRDGVLTITGDVTVKNTNPGTPTQDVIVIVGGTATDPIEVTLDGVNIAVDNSGGSAITIQAGDQDADYAESHVKLILTEDSTNTLKAAPIDNWSYVPAHAIDMYAGGHGYKGSNNTLTISGEGTLYAYGSNNSFPDAGGSGIYGGQYSVITIESGNVNAYGYGNKGGGITGYGGKDSKIVISGGEVNAYVEGNYNDEGAAIGGSVGTVEISGGAVTAVSENGGSAIGSAKGMTSPNITISGGTVTATAKGSGAAIGGGEISSTKNTIEITNGTVVATANTGVAIGWDKGDAEDLWDDPITATLTLSGGTVYAGSESGNGIGKGNAKSEVNLTTGAVIVTNAIDEELKGDSNLTGIILEGTGLEPNGITVTEDKGTVTVTGDITIPESATANIIVADGKTLSGDITNNGTLTVRAEGTIGTITNGTGAVLENAGDKDLKLNDKGTLAAGNILAGTSQITPPTGDDAKKLTVNSDGTVTIPGGSKIGDVEIPDTVSIKVMLGDIDEVSAGTEGLSLPAGSSVLSGDTETFLPKGGTVDSSGDIPEGTASMTIKDSKISVTVGEKTLTIDAGGWTLDRAAGKITVSANGKGSTSDSGTVYFSKGATIEPDGTITLTETNGRSGYMVTEYDYTVELFDGEATYVVANLNASEKKVWRNSNILTLGGIQEGTTITKKGAAGGDDQLVAIALGDGSLAVNSAPFWQGANWVAYALILPTADDEAQQVKVYTGNTTSGSTHGVITIPEGEEADLEKIVDLDNDVINIPNGSVIEFQNSDGVVKGVVQAEGSTTAIADDAFLIQLDDEVSTTVTVNDAGSVLVEDSAGETVVTIAPADGTVTITKDGDVEVPAGSTVTDADGNQESLVYGGTVSSDGTTAANPAPVAPNPSYPIAIADSENGAVTSSHIAATAGSAVTLTVAPEEGYELASLTVTDYLGNQIALSGSGSRYAFTMPASQVKVEAVFAPAGEKPGLPFTDVSEDNWAYGDIVYVYENGLMQGDSATIFDRLSSISRKEIVTILYRLAGEPAVAADNGFADVADGVWYADAVNWAVAEGVTQGVGGNRFDPDAAITRQDLAVMLWRYAGEPAGDLSALEGYRDEDSVSGYARAALAWAVEQGIVTGVGDSTLDPMGSAQRQQAAAMIRRLAESVQA